MNRDQFYATPLDDISDFQFNEQVVKVFPDMIKRSVPGYATILSQIPLLARQYAQPNSHCYDLGCSLGAATMMLQQGIIADHCKILSIDNSPAMIERCQQIVDATPANNPSLTTELICSDIETYPIENASIVILNFTLQFIPLERRHQIISTIYNGLRPGGILILSEKVKFLDHACNQWMVERHHDFKRQNGYSELEISQKRSALENVLVTEPLKQHLNRLRRCGFAEVYPWLQAFNFVSIFAAKGAASEEMSEPPLPLE